MPSSDLAGENVLRRPTTADMNDHRLFNVVIQYLYMHGTRHYLQVEVISLLRRSRVAS